MSTALVPRHGDFSGDFLLALLYSPNKKDGEFQ